MSKEKAEDWDEAEDAGTDILLMSVIGVPAQAVALIGMLGQKIADYQRKATCMCMLLDLLIDMLTDRSELARILREQRAELEKELEVLDKQISADIEKLEAFKVKKRPRMLIDQYAANYLQALLSVKKEGLERLEVYTAKMQTASVDTKVVH